MNQMDKQNDYYYDVLYGKATYKAEQLLHAEKPHLYRSSFRIEDFHFTSRLDLYCVAEQDGRVLFIDTGHERLCGTEPLDQAIGRFGASWDRAEVFLTHFHDDHDGNIAYALDRGAREVWCGPVPEYDPDQSSWFAVRMGAKKHDPELAGFNMATERYLYKRKLRYSLGNVVKEAPEGSLITIAGYPLEVLYTPGHTYEHISLLDRKEGFLFSGDHILDAPPGVMQIDENSHMLTRYLSSLSNIREMGLSTIYMAHHCPLQGQKDIRAFISRMICSYDKPLSVISDLLRELHESDVYTMAAYYYEYHRSRSFNDLDGLMRHRKVANMYAYLDYLTDVLGVCRRVSSDGRLVYSW